MPLITRPLPENFHNQLVARNAPCFGYGVDDVNVVPVGIAADFYGVAHLGHRPVSGDLAGKFGPDALIAISIQLATTDHAIDKLLNGNAFICRYWARFIHPLTNCRGAYVQRVS